MAVTIGEACHNESGDITGGIPGDQTGREVALNPYRSGFVIAYRCKDPAKANNIAEAMRQACMNDNIGYSQDPDQRYTMYQWMIKTGDIRKIAVKCSTDCSQLDANCCIIAGVSVSPYMTTKSADKILMETGMFEKITSFTEADLRKGDIIWKTGHMAVVVDAPEQTHENVLYVAAASQYCYVWADERKSARAQISALGQGNKVEVLSENGQFFKVRVCGSVIGYVEKTLKRV